MNKGCIYWDESSRGDTRHKRGRWVGEIKIDGRRVRMRSTMLSKVMEFTYKEMELHHILPWARFPELKQSIRNSVMLCHHCHKEVHCNPWRNIQMMQEKAQELGLNLKERYEGAQH